MVVVKRSKIYAIQLYYNCLFNKNYFSNVKENKKIKTIALIFLKKCSKNSKSKKQCKIKTVNLLMIQLHFGFKKLYIL